MRTRPGIRLGRLIALAALVAATLAPASAHAGTGQPLTLYVGTDQKLETLNPWQSITYADYEIFQVQYELLVGFGNDLSPVPGFADEWSSSADQTVHTFHIREGMKWSDGEPATCEDARYTYQFVYDAWNSDAGYVGSGYLEPYVMNAGLSKVECTDDHTLVATTEFPTTLLTQAYVPILPKHIWSKYTQDQISDTTIDGYFANEPPVVGSGPYVATEWEPGQFIKMTRNPNYWGTPGVPDEIVFQQFTGPETMVQALRNGELDYVRGTGADLFDSLKDQPNIRLAEGYANGYTYLSFNTRATQKGYKGSTSALEDNVFVDILKRAIDRNTLVDRVLNGHGVPGDMHVPPYHVNWYVKPTDPRTFDIADANARLDAAGYAKNADGKRVDKDGKVINLRLTWPDSEDHSTDAQFIKEWWEQLGIGVDAFQTEEGTLIDQLYGPETGDYNADWDTYIWGWGGDPDPQSLLSLFTTDQIEAGVNDCFYSNDRYDELFKLQQRATDVAQRKQYIAEMEQLFYDTGCNTPLYYDSELHAMRTDKFTGWVNQPPDTGTPLFGFGYSGYMALTDASAVPTAGPATAAPSAAPGQTTGPVATQPPATDNTGLSTPLVIGGLVVIAAVVVGGFLLMRRRPRVEEE
ncbi:MAG TPA: ABC transporter substrate-binding protein [Candidatus Limnocylindrales bacterium]|nr:ABC transporter substrate-binding protein [Candidatus Limnocylindrales bacterium]